MIGALNAGPTIDLSGSHGVAVCRLGALAMPNHVGLLLGNPRNPTAAGLLLHDDGTPSLGLASPNDSRGVKIRANDSWVGVSVDSRSGRSQATLRPSGIQIKGQGTASQNP